MSIEEWTTNPLLLLIIGAVFSSILIPFVTRRWQNHQAELQLERDLVEYISNSVTLFLTKLEFLERKGKSLDKAKQKELEGAELEWHKGCSSVGSHIQAYFLESSHVQITDHWKDYATLIDKFYRLTENYLTYTPYDKEKENVTIMSDDTREEIFTIVEDIKNIVTKLKDDISKNYKKDRDYEHDRRKDITIKIKQLFTKIKMIVPKKRVLEKQDPINKSSNEIEIKWDVLSLKSAHSHKDYLTQWLNVKKFIFDYKHALVKEIIKSRITGF